MPAAVPETLGEVHVHFLGLCNYLSTLCHTKIVPRAALKIALFKKALHTILKMLLV